MEIIAHATSFQMTCFLEQKPCIDNIKSGCHDTLSKDVMKLTTSSPLHMDPFHRLCHKLSQVAPCLLDMTSTETTAE